MGSLDMVLHPARRIHDFIPTVGAGEEQESDQKNTGFREVYRNRGRICKECIS